jgi:phage shock protein A
MCIPYPRARKAGVMATLDEIEQRLARLEERVDMEAGLRASGDRDLADLRIAVRGQHRMLQALADTQSEHTTALAAIGEHVERHDRALEAANTKLDQVIGMLGTLIERGDA